MAAAVICRQVAKRFGPTTVLAGLDWQIEPGTLVGLVGNSGSGKTTLLRLLAGLERPTAGEVRVTPGGNTALRVGMVFQNLALWPHLSARKHLRCVLGDVPRDRREAEIKKLLDEVHLPESTWDRRPGELSGGEGQRLAIARALAGNPQLLLLDEPLAQLDTVLRDELLSLIAGAVGARGATAVYVTHAWHEAAEICHRIAVLEAGQLAQIDTPVEVYWHPASVSVARLSGPVVELRREWIASGLIAAAGQFEGLPLESPADGCWVRPQQLRIVANGDAHPWQVVECVPQHSGWRVELRHESDVLRMHSPQHVAVGTLVGVTVTPGVNEAAIAAGSP